MRRSDVGSDVGQSTATPDADGERRLAPPRAHPAGRSTHGCTRRRCGRSSGGSTSGAKQPDLLVPERVIGLFGSWLNGALGPGAFGRAQVLPVGASDRGAGRKCRALGHIKGWSCGCSASCSECRWFCCSAEIDEAALRCLGGPSRPYSPRGDWPPTQAGPGLQPLDAGRVRVLRCGRRGPPLYPLVIGRKA
jgi:hypothetical protein